MLCPFSATPPRRLLCSVVRSVPFAVVDVWMSLRNVEIKYNRMVDRFAHLITGDVCRWQNVMARVSAGSIGRLVLLAGAASTRR